MTPAISKGITLTFTPVNTNIFTCNLLDVGLPDLKGSALKTTHQGTSPTAGVIWDTYIPSGFTDCGNLKCKVQYDITTVPPANTAGTLVIDYGSTTWTWINAIYLEHSGNAQMGNLIEGDVTFKLSGFPEL